MSCIILGQKEVKCATKRRNYNVHLVTVTNSQDHTLCSGLCKSGQVTKDSWSTFISGFGNLGCLQTVSGKESKCFIGETQSSHNFT